MCTCAMQNNFHGINQSINKDCRGRSCMSAAQHDSAFIIPFLSLRPPIFKSLCSWVGDMREKTRSKCTDQQYHSWQGSDEHKRKKPTIFQWSLMDILLLGHSWWLIIGCLFALGGEDPKAHADVIQWKEIPRSCGGGASSILFLYIYIFFLLSSSSEFPLHMHAYACVER